MAKDKRKTFAEPLDGEPMTPAAEAYLETGKADPKGLAPNSAGDPEVSFKQEARQFVLPPMAVSKDEALSILNMRIEAELVTALKTASMMRKYYREEPFHQRDLVEAALRPYLRKLGYYTK